MVRFFEFGRLKLMAAAGVITAVGVFALPASAATVCSAGVPDVSNQVTGPGGAPTFPCEFEVSVANSGNGAYDGLFFGGGWTEVNRVNNPGGTDGGLTLVGGLLSGTWSITSSLYDTWALVFKSASHNNTDPGEAVAYLVGGVKAGDYLSPVFRANCAGTVNLDPNCAREISHVALLGKNTNVIPLPAGLPLVLTAFGAFAFLRRRAAS